MRKEDEEVNNFVQKGDGSEIGQVMSHSAQVINMANTARPGETNGVIKMRTQSKEGGASWTGGCVKVRGILCEKTVVLYVLCVVSVEGGVLEGGGRSEWSFSFSLLQSVLATW